MRDRGELADAARDGHWELVLGLLHDDGKRLSPNHWRLGGGSWFTPLHQAAWHGAPVEVVEVVEELARIFRGVPVVDRDGAVAVVAV